MSRTVPDQPPERVIAWLRSPAGEAWSEERISSVLAAHHDEAGVFAEVIPDSRGTRARASWPDPGGDYDLGRD